MTAQKRGGCLPAQKKRTTRVRVLDSKKHPRKLYIQSGTDVRTFSYLTGNSLWGCVIDDRMTDRLKTPRQIHQSFQGGLHETLAGSS